MKHWTLAEYQEHEKQCSYYNIMDDEVVKHDCWECDGVFFECDMTEWQFTYNTKRRWYCNQCFKNLEE